MTIREPLGGWEHVVECFDILLTSLLTANDTSSSGRPFMRVGGDQLEYAEGEMIDLRLTELLL